MSETAPAGPVLPAETLDPATLTDEELRQRLQIQTADMSHGVVENARDKAHETLHRQTTGEIEGSNRFVRFAKRVKRAVWDANLKRDYTVLTEQVEGRREITREGNIHALHGGTKEDHDRTASAILDRVTSGFMHHDETQQEMKQVRSGNVLQDGLSKLVTEFAEGKIEIDVLVEKKDRLVGRFSHGLREAERLKGLLIADNVVDVARNARAARDHGIGMDRIQAAMSARHAEVQMGARTEVRRNAAEKAAEWLYRRKAGTLVNETSIAAAVAVTAVVTKFAIRKGASTAGNITRAATFGLINAGAGATAYVRESLHVKQDAQTHAREMALGGGDKLSAAGKYREQLEETRVKGVTAQELIGNLETAKASAGNGRDELQAAIATLTEARSRISLSDEEKVDLITWSSRVTADVERTQLDIKLAEARAAVQKALEGADTSTLTAAGIDILRKDARNVGAVIDARSEAVEEQLLEPVDAHDEAVKKLARNKALKAAGVAMVTGSVLGMVLQETQGAVSGSVQGVFEKNTGEERRTMLAGIFRTDEHNPGIGPNPDNMTTVGKHAAFVPPKGYNLQHVDGKWELFDSKNNVVDSDVTFDSDGHLSEASQHALTEKGFHFSEQAQTVTDPNAAAHKDVPLTPSEYVKAHSHEFSQIHRTEWMANNTEVPDGNEQRLDWGGTNGTGIDEHGNYALSLARMTSDGSFEHGLSEDAHKLMLEGKLKVALSMTEGTQTHVVMVPVDKHGNAIIEKGSFAARAMFSRHDGQLHFTGAYAEAVVLGDTQPNGTQNVHVLATVIGENHVNHDALIDRQPVIKPASHEQIITSLSTPETTAPVEMPLVLPVRGRRGLEYVDTSSPANSRNRGNYLTSYLNSEAGKERERRWEEERSPRLRENPDAQLKTGEELNWYRGQLEAKRGKEYLDELDGYIDNDPVLANIDNSIDAVVCMPVAAANEADNIYNTLSQYAQQSASAKEKTVVLMNLNWKEEIESDPEKMDAVRKTIAEIERAKADFPDLKIATFQKVWSKELVEQRNGALFGEVVKVLYDTAAMAMERSIKSGRREDRDAVLITNDADVEGMKNNYLDIYLQALEKYPDSDAFTGLIRFGTETHGDFPGFGISTNVMALLAVAAGRTKGNYRSTPSTSGANAGFRMSTFAAIGGCEDRPDMGAGADTILGRKLKAARASAGAGTPEVGGMSGASAGPSIPVTTALPVSPAPTRSRPNVVKFLGGAQIDTNADRFIGVYRRGGFVGNSWNNFDEGSYRDRRENLKGLVPGNREDARVNIDAIARRIEREVSFLGTEWYPEPALVSWALGAYFGVKDKRGRPIYAMDWQDDGLHFSFTKEGKVWLRDSLLKDSKGRPDPYGARIARQLYGRVDSKSARQPSRPVPPFVSAA